MKSKKDLGMACHYIPPLKKSKETGGNLLLLVCELFRAHEMLSQLEVTEMLQCKVNLMV